MHVPYNNDSAVQYKSCILVLIRIYLRINVIMNIKRRATWKEWGRCSYIRANVRIHYSPTSQIINLRLSHILLGQFNQSVPCQSFWGQGIIALQSGREVIGCLILWPRVRDRFPDHPNRQQIPTDEFWMSFFVNAGAVLAHEPLLPRPSSRLQSWWWTGRPLQPLVTWILIERTTCK